MPTSNTRYATREQPTRKAGKTQTQPVHKGKQKERGRKPRSSDNLSTDHPVRRSMQQRNMGAVRATSTVQQREHKEDDDQRLVFVEEGQRAQQEELVETEQAMEPQAALPLQPPPPPQMPSPHAEAVEQEERRQVGDGGITMVVLAEECMNGGN